LAGSQSGAETRDHVVGVTAEPVEATTAAPNRDERQLRRDLAESRRALTRERERWDDLFHLAPVPFVVTDAVGVVRHANVAAEDLFGVTASRLVSKALAAFLGAREVREAVSAAGADVQRRELVVRRRGRPPVRAEVALRLLDPHAHDAGDAVVWSFHEIEQREAARDEVAALAARLEERVRERTAAVELERARLLEVIRRAPAGIVVADGASRRLVEANEEASRLLGVPIEGFVLPRADLEGYDHDGNRLPGDEWPLARALLRGETVTQERLRVRRPDSTWITVEINAAPIRGADGGVASAVAIFWDVTEREGHERAERDFVTNAAHELQTPLAAIISAAEVLAAGAKDDPDARDRFIGHIRRECDRLARLVHALLTLARAQTGTEEPATEAVLLRPMLDGVALSLQPPVGVEVRVDCAAKLCVRANPFLLEQAVAGLAGNAAKYGRQGTIWLRARRRRAGGVEIEVVDEGSGIAPGEEERLFERFYRGGRRDAGGFGLGLAIVREAVTTLGGTVALERRDPAGTVARITLPAGAE